MSSITNMKSMFTTKLARFAAICVGCAIVVTNINPSFAQSTDRDNPTPLTEKILSNPGKQNSLTVYYYSLTAKPGKITITLDSDVGSVGGSSSTTVRIQTLDGNNLKTISASSNSGNPKRTMGNIEFSSETPVLLLISSSGYHKIKIDGEWARSGSASTIPTIGSNPVVTTSIDPKSRSDNPKSFAQWCQEKASVSPSRRLTIDILLKEAGTNDCNIADIKLKSIRGLHITRNQISDLTPLASLTNLTTLSIQFNQIIDINSIASLTNLKNLNLLGNKIVDIKPLVGLTNLEVLRLHGNQIIDIKPLAGLTKVKVLSLYNNKIIDVRPLAGLTHLKDLSIQFNKIFDINPLADLNNLRFLALYDNKIIDIKPLAGLTNLRTLSLGRNQIIDIKVLAGLTNLYELDLKSNKIVDLQPLAGLNNLKTLDLQGNKIVDIKPLAGLTNLETIDIKSNKVFDLKPLTGLRKLKQVSGSIPLF
jgi:internalin A